MGDKKTKAIEYADKMEKATPEQVQHIIEKFTKKEAEE